MHLDEFLSFSMHQRALVQLLAFSQGLSNSHSYSQLRQQLIRQENNLGLIELSDDPRGPHLLSTPSGAPPGHSIPQVLTAPM